MNILILAAGPVVAGQNRDGGYPLCLTEIDGVPLIEVLYQACAALDAKQVVYALRDEDVRRFHLDKVVELLGENTQTLVASDRSKGAACTSLLAVDLIDNDDELLIVNGDSIHDVDYVKVVENFRQHKLDAGTIIFSSVHPRYSYVRLDEEGLVVEATEKNPISRNATAGFYWYARGSDFVRAVKAMIRKDAHVGDSYYICPAFNELVLEQRRIGVYSIDVKNYHQLKTERQLTQFENSLECERN